MRTIQVPIPAPERVLIVRLSALGDVVHCLPAVEALHQLWPDCRLDWVTESLGASVIDGHPLIGEVIPLRRAAWKRRIRRPSGWPEVAQEGQRFLERFRRDFYDVVVDFQGNLRSRTVVALARHGQYFSHHPSEVKEIPRWLTARAPAEPAGRVNRVEKNLHLVRALGWKGEIPRGRLPDYGAERDELAAHGFSARERFVILHPGASAFGQLKMWPPAHFAELGRQLAERGHRVIVTWGPSERNLATGIVEAAGPGVELAPPTPEPRLMASLLGLASLVVAADTGPLHVAAAAGVPVVSLFGPKDPVIYRPWTEKGRSARTPIPCSPCLLRRCDHAVCMQLVLPQSVLPLALELIGDPA